MAILSIFTSILLTLLLVTTGKRLNRSDPQLQLMHDLFEDYDKYVLPVLDFNTPIHLAVDFTPVLISDLNEKDQVLTLFSWLTRVWVDERLAWNITEYEGVKKIFPGLERIWMPDMTVENSADQMYSEIINGNFITDVSYDGTVGTYNAGKTITACVLDMTYFPFDQHSCIVKLSNWVYSYDQIRLENMTYKLDMTYYQENAQWRVMDAFMVLTSMDVDNISYESIDVTLVLKRKPAYYMFNFVVPSAVLAMMSNLMFCLPPESGERISLGITVLLSFSVFQFMIMDKMPESSDNIPVLTIYLTTLMAMSSLSLVISVIIINKYHRSEAPPPAWMSHVSKNGISCGKCSKKIQTDTTTVTTNLKPGLDHSMSFSLPSKEMNEEWKLVLARLDTIFLISAFFISVLLFTGVFIGLSTS